MATPDRHPSSDVPCFDGFPYWLTWLAPGIHHVTLLPSLPEPVLAHATILQVRANRLPICLVLAANRALYVGPDNDARLSDQPPRGGHYFAGRLEPVLPPDPSSPDFHARVERLAALLDAQDTQGALFGDLTKGGRAATTEELRSLEGLQADGTPRGLQRCTRCGDWAGTCLDPSEVFAGFVMTVHCRCDNHNRCARCGHPLAERRLNANYYDPKDAAIWHVPGFEAFGHRCVR